MSGGGSVTDSSNSLQETVLVVRGPGDWVETRAAVKKWFSCRKKKVSQSPTLNVQVQTNISVTPPSLWENVPIFIVLILFWHLRPPQDVITRVSYSKCACHWSRSEKSWEQFLVSIIKQVWERCVTFSAHFARPDFFFFLAPSEWICWQN